MAPKNRRLTGRSLYIPAPLLQKVLALLADYQSKKDAMLSELTREDAA